MRAKILISISAFLVTFVFSSVMPSVVFPVLKNDYTAQQRICRLLEQNQLNISSKNEKLWQRNFKISGKTPESFLDPLEEYGEASERLNSAELPEDFRAAWKRYATFEREWADFLNHLESMPDSLTLSPIEKPIAEEKIAEQEKAWNDVVMIAKRYGVMINVNGSVYLK